MFLSAHALLSTRRTDTKVFNIQAVDEAAGTTQWNLADVRVNRGDKGRPMTKKQKSLRFDLPISSIRRVNLYVDM